MREAALHKELLHRLFELIRAGNGEVHKILQEDAHSRALAQQLGMEVPEYVERLQAQSLPYARETSRGQIEGDVSQREALQRRRAITGGADNRGAMETDPPTVVSSRSGTSDQSNPPALADLVMASSGIPDARDQYRLFCFTDHTAPSIEIISIFGEIPFPPAEIMTTHGSRTLRQQQVLNLRIPEYLIQPLLFGEERCPMAAVYTDFRDYGRRQIAAGMSAEAVLGSPKIDLALYLRERKADDPHTPATWACEFMRLLKDFDIYVALACIFTYARFMHVSYCVPSGRA